MKPKSNPFLRQSLALAASSAFLSMGSAHGATYDWTGTANSNFTDGANWSQNSWDQWSDYRIGGTPTNTAITIDGYFGMASLTLQSGLTTDIVINSSNAQPVIMHTGIASNGLALISIDANSSNLTINGEYIAGSAVTWDVGAGRTLTMNGQLNNWFATASLIKNGAGTAVLAGSNGYSGGTTVNGGTLSLAAAGALPSGGGVAIGAGGKLSNDAPTGNSFALNGLTLTGGELAATSTPDTSLGNFYLNGDVTVSGSMRSTISADVRVISNQTRDFNVSDTGDISGVDLLISGKLGHQNNVAWGFATKSGAGTMKLSGINQIGTMTINAGRLILEDTAAGWGYDAGGLTNNAELEYSVTSGSRGNSGSHSGSGNLYKTGAGTQTLSGGLSYTGTTTVAGGTLNLQDTIGAGGSNYNGGNININGASTLRVSGLRYNFGGETFTFDSVGGGALDAIASGAGGMVFMGNNTFVTSGGAQNIISGTRIANEGFNLNGQTATFNVATGTDATSDLKVTGTLWNGGNVVKDGAGRMEISSTQQYSGTTTVTGGTLIVSGNISTSSMTTVQTGASLGGAGTVGSLTIDSGAFLNPGNSPGILTVDGDYNQAGTLTIEITGTTPGIGGYDQVNVDLTTGDFDGSVTLSGSLVTAFSGGSYVNGNLLFILLNDASDAISGTFSGFAQDAIVANYGGFDWKISYTADSTGNTFSGGNDVALMAVPEPNVAALLGGLGMLALLRRRR